MSQTKITNFFGKPKIVTSNGSSKVVMDSKVKRRKDNDVDTAEEAQEAEEENTITKMIVTKKRKINEFFNNPNSKKLNNSTGGDQSTLQSQTNSLDLWTSTYRPRSTDQLVGNVKTRAHFFDWLSSWHANFVEDGCGSEITTGKCAFICGPSGTGKTSTVYATAADCQLSVLEFNCSSLRVSPAFLAKEIGESVKSHCITLKSSSRTFGKSLILLDDFDALLYECPPVSLEEVWRQLRQLITTSQKPIVITAAFQPTFFCQDEQLMYFRQFRLGRIQSGVLRKHLLETIAAKEPMASNASLCHYVRDARRLINECQFWCYSSASSRTYPLPTCTRKPVNAQLLIQQMELLSFEDLYQTTLNRLLCESTELGDYYDCHLFDRRDSLLTTTPLELQCTGEDSSNFDELNESICMLIADNYLPLTPHNPDYFALFFDLISLRPTLLAELEKLFSKKQMRQSGRLKRHQKLSFRYL